MATKRKVKRYDEGGVTQDDLDAANSSDDAIATLNSRKGWTDTGEEATTRGLEAPAKKESFKDAFASARKAGDKTFTWNGKSFTTELAAPKKAAAPVAAEKPAAKSTYETPYDRMNRQNREQGIDFDSMVGKLKNRITGAADRIEERYKNNPVRTPARGRIETDGYKKGGTVKSAPARKSASSRGDGIAKRGLTRA
jgi:hypothetical protein